MRRSAVVLAITLGGCGRRSAAPPPSSDDARAPVAIDAAGPPVHAFVHGTVVVAARAAGLVRPLRLDPATGTWTALGAGDAHLFPTEVAEDDAVLVVVARG